MCSYMPATSQFKKTCMEVPDPWFDDDAARTGFHRVSCCMQLRRSG